MIWRNWRFSELQLEQLTNEIIDNIFFANQQSLHFISAHALVEGYENNSLSNIFSKCELICDSRPLAWYFQYKSDKLVQIRGVDFMKSLIKKSPKNSKHFFLGGNTKVKNGILNYIVEIGRNDLKIYFESPPIVTNWEDYISDWIQKIEFSKPNYVWVGMGAPKQFYISDAIATQLDLPTFSVGAAFDFISKNKKESPKILTNIGLEWLYRLCQEPKRLWKRYLVGNFKFIIILIKNHKKFKKRIPCIE